MTFAEQSAAAEAEDGESTHEALLRRHGLISHVALLPDGTPPEAAARFQSEAARKARNLIPLSPRRFGLLLDAPGTPISTVPHTLLPDSEPSTPGPGAPRQATPDEAAEADHASRDAPERAPAAGTAADEATLRPVGPDAEDTPEDADPAPDAPEGAATADAMPEPDLPDPPTGDDGPSPNVLASDDRAGAADTGTAGTGWPSPAAQEGAPPALTEIAAKLERLEARLDQLDGVRLAAELAASVDDLVARRLERMEDRVHAALSRPDAPPDPLPADRVDSFWSGLEEALRLLHTQVRDLQAAADRLRADGQGDPGAALAELETTIAMGFEAAGEAREANHDAISGRLATLEGATAQQEERLVRALAPLPEQLAEIETALAALGSRPDRDAALVAAIGSMGDGIASLVDERLPAGAATLVQSVERLSEQIARTLQATGLIDGRLAEIERRPAAAPAAELGPALQPLAAGLENLTERLEARGGILSEAVETSHRSMKNFWLAAEDALGRLETALGRLEAAANASPPDGTEGAGPADQNGCGAIRTLEKRLDGIESCLASGARDRADLRVAMAELLARTSLADSAAWKMAADTQADS